jgi:hypothetical protein
MAGLFHNAKEASALRTVLMEMGHEQPPTPLVTDNVTAAGIANDTVKQKQSKAMDMRFYWLRDRGPDGQKQFVIYWRKGITNLADYFTKGHSAAHHREQRPKYIHEQAHFTQQMYDTYEEEVWEYYVMSMDSSEGEVDHMALFYATFEDEEP